MIKFIFLKIYGWKIKGENNFTEKCIIIVAPHTHWLDFFLKSRDKRQWWHREEV